MEQNDNNPENTQLPPKMPHQDKIIDMDSLNKIVDLQQSFEDTQEIRFCNRCSTPIEGGVWCPPCAEVIGQGQ